MNNNELTTWFAEFISRLPISALDGSAIIAGADKENLALVRQLLFTRACIIDDLNAVIEKKGKQIDDMSAVMDDLKAEIVAKQRASMQSELESVKRNFVNTLIDRGQFALRVAHQASIDEYTMYTIANNVLREFRYQLVPQDELPF